MESAGMRTETQQCTVNKKELLQGLKKISRGTLKGFITFDLTKGGWLITYKMLGEGVTSQYQLNEDRADSISGTVQIKYLMEALRNEPKDILVLKINDQAVIIEQLDGSRTSVIMMARV